MQLSVSGSVCLIDSVESEEGSSAERWSVWLSRSGDLAVLLCYRPLRPPRGVRADAQLVVFRGLAAMERDAAMPADVVEAAARAMDRVVAGSLGGWHGAGSTGVLRYRWRCGACGNEGTVMVEPGKARDGVYGCVVEQHREESAACPELRLDLLVPLEPPDERMLRGRLVRKG